MVHDIYDHIRSWNISKRFHLEDKVRLLTQSTVDREIYSGVITLKNLAIVYKDRPLSSESILEILMTNSKRLRKSYQKLLSEYRTGKREECFKNFALDLGTKSGKNFATILSKLDLINPAELLEQLEVFQNMMIEIRTTEEMKAVEKKSVIGTILSTATVFALLINFAVVVVFLSTLDMLNGLF